MLYLFLKITGAQGTCYCRVDQWCFYNPKIIPHTVSQMALRNIMMIWMNTDAFGMSNMSYEPVAYVIRGTVSSGRK